MKILVWDSWNTSRDASCRLSILWQIQEKWVRQCHGGTTPKKKRTFLLNAYPRPFPILSPHPHVPTPSEQEHNNGQNVLSETYICFGMGRGKFLFILGSPKVKNIFTAFLTLEVLYHDFDWYFLISLLTIPKYLMLFLTRIASAALMAHL